MLQIVRILGLLSSTINVLVCFQSYAHPSALASAALLMVISWPNSAFSYDHGPLPSTFGLAHKFHPLPDTVVGAHCAWEVRLNTVFNRIPPIITEIVCQKPNDVCGGNSNYQCRQINYKMTVAYTNIDNHAGIEHRRNTTVAVGCSCVMKHSTQLEMFNHYINEKKRSSPALQRDRNQDNYEDGSGF